MYERDLACDTNKLSKLLSCGTGRPHCSTTSGSGTRRDEIPTLSTTQIQLHREAVQMA